MQSPRAGSLQTRPAGPESSVAGKLLSGALPEAVAGALVGAERLVVGVFGSAAISSATARTSRCSASWCFGSRSSASTQVSSASSAAAPARRAARRAESRPGCTQTYGTPAPVWGADETVDLRILGLDLRDDVADRLVDERKPDLLVPAIRTEYGQRSGLRARQTIWAATSTRRPANSRRSALAGSASASAAPPCAATAAATPRMAAARQRTLP